MSLKVLVTGMSGTGKSTALQKLGERGHRVVLLSAPADIILARIADRENNNYGKSPEERNLILRHLAEVEPLLRATATTEIDASAPLEEVVQRLEHLS